MDIWISTKSIYPNNVIHNADLYSSNSSYSKMALENILVITNLTLKAPLPYIFYVKVISSQNVHTYTLNF